MQVHHDRAMIWRCLGIPNDVGSVYMTLLEPALNVDGKIILAQASTVCRSSCKSANCGDCCASRPTSMALSSRDRNFHIRRRVGGDIQQIINRCDTYREYIVLLGHQMVLALFFLQQNNALALG